MTSIRLAATTAIEEAYAKDLSDIEEAYANQILNGSAQNYAEYQHLVGVIKGLNLAKESFNHFTDAARRLEEEP